MSITPLIKELKEQNQDFEFYPTTREIIEAMFWDIKGLKKPGASLYNCKRGLSEYEYFSLSLLDIGAGNGKVLSTINQINEENKFPEKMVIDGKEEHLNYFEQWQKCLEITQYFVIEKSQILINNMPEKAIVMGTDFYENTLIDKRADVIFCNPPYSEYEIWTERIIKEANAAFIYLVIPQRWGNHRGIAKALKDRMAKVKIVGNFDFMNAEDRKARAKVSLVKVDLAAANKFKRLYRDMSNIEPVTDPFELWFNETFNISANEPDVEDLNEKDRKKSEAIKAQIVPGEDLIQRLVELYNNEFNKLLKNYQILGELDSEIFEELNVDIKSLLAAFKEKVKGLKNLYWQEIFSNLTPITERLTTNTRKSLLSTLISNSSMDFTESNIMAIVIWVIKNAHKYFESQLLSFYDNFTTEEGIKFYKSNQHFMKDSWRYLKEKGIKYALDYRIVLYGYRDYSEERDNVISRQQQEYISDLKIIARQLMFDVEPELIGDKNILYYDQHGLKIGCKGYLYTKRPKSRRLKVGTKTNFGKIDKVWELDDGTVQYEIDGRYYHYSIVTVDEDIFTTIKGFKNGNIHYQLNKEFVKKLNLEVGRIRNWIRSPQEAAEEMDITIDEAVKYWDKSFKLLPSNVGTLLPNFKLDIEENNKSKEVETADEVVKPKVDVVEEIKESDDDIVIDIITEKADDDISDTTIVASSYRQCSLFD